MTIAPGMRLGQYEIVSLIGGGGEQPQAASVVVVVNWFAELQRLVPTDR